LRRHIRLSLSKGKPRHHGAQIALMEDRVHVVAVSS
jgi:hypothetical protein